MVCLQAQPSSTHKQQHKQQGQQSSTAAAASSVSVEVIPRSREVGQSYITSVFTTLYSLLWAFWMVTRHRPQLVSTQAHTICQHNTTQHSTAYDSTAQPVTSHLLHHFMPQGQGSVQSGNSCEGLLWAAGACCCKRCCIASNKVASARGGLSVCCAEQVLVNGPGTCIPVCAAAFVNRCVQSLALDQRLTLFCAVHTCTMHSLHHISSANTIADTRIVLNSS